MHLGLRALGDLGEQVPEPAEDGHEHAVAGAHDRGQLVARLFAFNAGVELGQVAALAPLVGLSLGLSRLGPRGDVARRALAVGLVLVGVVTALARATGG